MKLLFAAPLSGLPSEEAAQWHAERLLVQWSAHGVAYKDLTRDIGSAVLLYRSKFSDCPVGTVANSYPNVDLLWDNVIAGPWGVAPALQC